MTIRAVIFDWDGTIVDSAEPTYRCYARLFAELGVAFDRQTYARTYSPNWYETFRALGVPQERWPHADARWLAHFAEETVELIDGVHDTLRELLSRGIDAAIVTSGSRERIAFLPRRGIVGVDELRVSVHEISWDPYWVLVLHTDGLRTHWQWDDFPGLGREPAKEIASRLMRDLAIGNDDATVLAVKSEAP